MVICGLQVGGFTWNLFACVVSPAWKVCDRRTQIGDSHWSWISRRAVCLVATFAFGCLLLQVFYHWVVFDINVELVQPNVASLDLEFMSKFSIVFKKALLVGA